MIDESQKAATEAESTTSFADALEESLRKEKFRRFRKGDRVAGKVVKIGESMAFIDLGDRAEAMLDLNDLRRPDGTLEVEEGDEVEAIVLDIGANGLLLKRSLGRSKESATQIHAAFEAGIPVQAQVTGVNKGGLELDLFGLRAFCPASQFDLRKIEDFQPFIGETFEFRITEATEDGKRIVLSRRALLQEERDRQLAEIRAKLAPGAVVKGTVSRIQPFGAFVDFGGIEGLIHITELSRGRVSDPSDVVEVGQEVEVQILKVEETTDKNGKKVERIALSLKALEKDPWSDASERFPLGARVPGRVVRIQPFGAFVELAPGIDGLVHISEMADRRIAHPSDVVKEGDEVMVTVLSVDADRKRLSLSLKEPRTEASEEERGEGRRERRPGAGPRKGGRRDGRERAGGRGERRREPTEVHEVTVEKVEPFGVIVKLPDGNTAVVPNLELGTPKGADHRKLFPPGTSLKVAIIGQDRTGQPRASKVEAEKAEERAAVREWTEAQEKAGAGSFGNSLADLLRKANIVK